METSHFLIKEVYLYHWITLLEEVKMDRLMILFETRQFYFYTQNNKEMSNFFEFQDQCFKIS